MSGMVFLSKGFAVGSGQYNALTSLVSILVIVSTLSFIALVVVEVYRSIRDTKKHDAARRAEAERLERQVMATVSLGRMLSRQHTRAGRPAAGGHAVAADGELEAKGLLTKAVIKGGGHGSSAPAELATRKSRMLNMARDGAGRDGGQGVDNDSSGTGDAVPSHGSESGRLKHVPMMRGGNAVLLADGLSAGGYRSAGASPGRTPLIKSESP